MWHKLAQPDNGPVYTDAVLQVMGAALSSTNWHSLYYLMIDLYTLTLCYR